jgi:putative endonuclease
VLPLPLSHIATAVWLFFMPFHCYILYSAMKDQYYVGSTGDELSEWLRRHLSDHKGFTGKAKDWIISYAESYDTKEAAMAREKQIKGWKSKRSIRELIEWHSSTDSGHPG